MPTFRFPKGPYVINAKGLEGQEEDDDEDDSFLSTTTTHHHFLNTPLSNTRHTSLRSQTMDEDDDDANGGVSADVEEELANMGSDDLMQDYHQELDSDDDGSGSGMVFFIFLCFHEQELRYAERVEKGESFSGADEFCRSRVVIDISLPLILSTTTTSSSSSP
ncbi:hypothetical protein Fcan01_02257 [Folsomia candida]|uniref:Uncharacterized protein n=1 Tax=Folsomia candida TaxID=158441 RepID=A0A226F5K6_FOLCA|nr:hypothetical protein Fcan01_02257 [Folsomia candida]